MTQPHQYLAITQELAADIMAKLRKLPWEEADSTIRRIQTSQVVTLNPEQPHGDSNQSPGVQ